MNRIEGQEQSEDHALEDHALEELESSLGSASTARVDIGIEGIESGQFQKPPSVAPTVLSLKVVGLEERDARGEVALHRIVTPDFRIGRHPECNLVLHEDPKISRRHARIVCMGDEHAIEDNSSPNGTFVNGQRLAQVALLKPGDKVRIGSHEFTYVSRSNPLPGTLLA